MSRRFCPLLSCLAPFAFLASACQAAPAITATAMPAPTTAPPGPSPVPVTLTPTAPASPEPLWTFQTEGAIWGSPAVDNGTVYVGSDDGNLYAVEAKTGRSIWKFVSQGIVRSQPAISSGLVYIASDDGFLYAIHAQDGTQAWRTDIGNALARDIRERLGTSTSPTGWDYMQSSPMVAEGRVYVGSLNGKVYALASDTGQVAWTYQTGAKVRSTPVLDNGTLYVGSWDKYAYALDAQSGQLRWKTFVEGEVQSTALIASNLVYTASRKASVVALDSKTGEAKWEYSYGTNMWVESSPVLANGTIFIGSSGSRWILGLESQSGKCVTTFNSKAFHWSTPAIADKMLFIGGASFRSDKNAGGLYGLQLVDGAFASAGDAQWYFPIEKTVEAEGNWSGVASSPMVADEVVYFAGLDGKLYAIAMKP